MQQYKNENLSKRVILKAISFAVNRAGKDCIMRDLKTVSQVLDSREVADIVEKPHSALLEDIRRYIQQFKESNLSPDGFFLESSYQDSRGAACPCYQITKKGCEFIAHKLNGIKGSVFTFRYIDYCHQIQECLLCQKQEPALPWFIRRFQGSYILLERDFIAITGVNIKKHKLFYHRDYFKKGFDYNGWGWKCDNESFRKRYGFDYGSDPCMIYFYPRGVRAALAILTKGSKTVMTSGAYHLLMDGLKRIPSQGELARYD